MKTKCLRFTIFSVVFLCLFFFLSLLQGLVACVCASEFTVKTIQKAYEGIKDIRGNFVQKSHIKDLKRTDIFKGTFLIKVPSQMRWQYSGDNKQTDVAINKGEIIIYQKSEKQAFKGTFDRERYGQAPMALLGGFGDIEKEFGVTQKDGKLLLRPKKGMGGIVSIEITPSDGEFPIRSLTIVDTRSNRIEITLKEVTLNTGIRDSAFDISLPKEVSVYENNHP